MIGILKYLKKKPLFVGVVAALAALVFIVAAVLAGPKKESSDRLPEDAKLLLSWGSYDPKAKSEAFLFLAGIYVPENEDPIEEGGRWLAEVRRHEENREYEIKEYPDDKKIHVSSKSLPCEFSNEDCLASLFSLEVDLKPYVENAQLLASRFQEFISLHDFKTLTKPSLYEVYPQYTYITYGARQSFVNEIHRFNGGEKKLAVENMEKYFLSLRALYERQDLIVGKLVVERVLSEAIDVISLMIVQAPSLTMNGSLASLSKEERNYTVVAGREFFAIHHTAKTVKEFPGAEKSISEKALIRVFRPDVAAGFVAPHFMRMAKLANLEPEDYAVAIEKEVEIVEPRKYSRDYLEYSLARVAVPNYQRYTAGVLNLVVKIKLFNDFHVNGVVAEEIANPFYPEKHAYRDKSSVCIETPTPQEPLCLKIGM